MVNAILIMMVVMTVMIADEFANDDGDDHYDDDNDDNDGDDADGDHYLVLFSFYGIKFTLLLLQYIMNINSRSSQDVWAENGHQAKIH